MSQGCVLHCHTCLVPAGVEQATNSMMLQSYQFPQRCVLLLGNEQSGVPAAILPLLDVCVEIPMLGVTRSLNAHVSGAMVLWQYTQQQLAAGVSHQTA
jgi:tRNA G18 (ribose-2'-O)-methylase SpoU